MTNTSASSASPPAASNGKASIAVPSRSSLLVTLVLQDASLLVIAIGLSLSAVSLIASLAFPLDAAQSGESSLLSSVMMVGVGMVVVGLLNAMLQYSNRKRNAAPGEVVLPPGHPPISEEVLKSMVELDENGKPKQRISKCPLGF